MEMYDFISSMWCWFLSMNICNTRPRETKLGLWLVYLGLEVHLPNLNGYAVISSAAHPTVRSRKKTAFPP
jgi:hypothetical protein